MITTLIAFAVVFLLLEMGHFFGLCSFIWTFMKPIPEVMFQAGIEPGKCGECDKIHYRARMMFFFFFFGFDLVLFQWDGGDDDGHQEPQEQGA